MAIRLCVLGSGSSGNCSFIGTERTGLLVDAGLSARETEKRLAQIGVPMSAIQAICISHEHKDHTAGIAVLHKKFGMALYANSPTMEGISLDPKTAGLPWNLFSNGQSFRVGDLDIAPFTVPHDAQDPVGFVICAGPVKVGIATDMGVPTTLIRERLRGCRLLVLESNHDEAMLHQAQRPYYLKQRILGRQGHLSNTRAAELLCEVAGPELQQVFLAHISRECNCHDLAMTTMRRHLDQAGLQHVKVALTHAGQVSELWSCA